MSVNGKLHDCVCDPANVIFLKINVVAQWYLVTWRESMNHQTVYGIYVHICIDIETHYSLLNMHKDGKHVECTWR